MRTFVVLSPVRSVLGLDLGGERSLILSWRLRRWVGRGDRCLPAFPERDSWRAALVLFDVVRCPSGRREGERLRFGCLRREGVDEEVELGGGLRMLGPLLISVGSLLGGREEEDALVLAAGLLMPL